MMTRQTMVRLALGASAMLLGACANKAPPPLYVWDGFPKRQYEALQRTDGGVPAEQLLAMQAHADKARAARAALPPGFRAHWGMLKLSAGDAGGARDAWLAEKAAFPESAQYMDRLLEKLQTPRTDAAKENPA